MESEPPISIDPAVETEEISNPPPPIEDFFVDVDEYLELPQLLNNSIAILDLAVDNFSGVQSDPIFDPTLPDVLQCESVQYGQNEFMLLLGIWCEKYFISRKAWSALREALQTVNDIKVFSNLPAKLDTVKRRSRSQLPGFNLRHKKIGTNCQKQPSKKKNQGSSQGPLTISGELYWFDPVELVTAILSAPSISSKLHKGMAEIVDSPIELWHFLC